MPTVKRFEELECWRKSRELTKAVYGITSRGDFGKDFGLKDQIRRASVSVMLNIAEGFARGTDREFRQFLVQAHGSCAEVQTGLYVAVDQSYVDGETFRTLYESTEEVSKMILSLAGYLVGRDSGVSTLDSRQRGRR